MRRRPFILAVLAVAAFGCIAGLAAVLYIGVQLTRPLGISEDKVYVFESGQTATHLTEMLRNDGLVDHSVLFNLAARWSGFARQLKAGEYSFQSQYSILDVFRHVADGKSVTYPITFVEGWAFKDFLVQLDGAQNLVKTLGGKSQEQILSVLGISKDHPEGWFFPDTYRYTGRQSDADILLTAHRAMKQALAAEWDNRASDLPYENSYQALIAASIIQKEAGVASEFPIISGVIVNRLNRGMRLQMDPTVIYGMGDEYTGVIRRSDLKRDTEYNTYTRHGLPPTPIAMPGRAAIHAAVRPKKTSALYFVARGDGTHQFTDNLEDHLIAVRKYRELMRQRSK